jgi:hypothetical protein
MNKRIEEHKSECKFPDQKIKLKTDDKYHIVMDIENLSMGVLYRQEVEDVMTDQSKILFKGYKKKNLPTKITITAELKGIKTNNKKEEAIGKYLAYVKALWS